MSSSQQFVFAKPGTTGLVSPQEYTEMFLFLHKEWLDADAWLEAKGFPAKEKVDDEVIVRSLVERMELRDAQ